MAVTIKDVALRARVSIASVSRALHGTGVVTEKTRLRVERAARQLRYTPHGVARSLITRRTNTIGVLLPDIYGEYFSELIRGIDRAARLRGLHLLVSSSHGDAEEASLALRAMNGRVDGVLIMSPYVDAQLLGNALPATLPTVLLNTPDNAARAPAFMIDDFGGAKAMVEHLRGPDRKATMNRRSGCAAFARRWGRSGPPRPWCCRVRLPRNPAISQGGSWRRLRRARTPSSPPTT